MRSNTYTLVFTSIITIILGFFLSLAASSLKDIQDLNVENDMKKNILLSLGFEQNEDSPWTSDEIQKLFDKN
ncbi:MAG: Na(+)-translocating NADH-quinone reductase subunit C, partial [Candidatus Marinimicrobia bacterium]|nr:Na(+)-translocating NADH-quinone reductase subunit C [Candidatus Neomarinimicrobiota bacterium]